MSLVLLLVAIFVRDLKNVLAVGFVLGAISIASLSNRGYEVPVAVFGAVVSVGVIVGIGRAVRFAYLWIRERNRKRAFTASKRQ